MRKATLCGAADSSNVLQAEMRYCDLHCDALTQTGKRQVTKENLQAGECALQCFAAFVSSREDRFSSALSLCDRFDELIAREGYRPVRSASDFAEGELCAMLTVEEGGAIEGSLEKLRALYARGVRMLTLTWNYPNEIGYPAFPDYEGLLQGRVSPTARETERGLTPFGVSAVEEMNALGMIVDVSHGSDKLIEDVARVSKKPFAASHSNANAVCNWARNLQEKHIRSIAQSGGVVGLNFCADFLSPDASAEGQKQAILAHAQAIIDAGGEDVLAVGSDFDGIPPNPFLKNPAHMPNLAQALAKKFGSAVAEKICYKNAVRFLRDSLR